MNLPTLDTSGLLTKRTVPSHGERRCLLTHLSGDDYIMNMDWTSIQAHLMCSRKSLWQLIHARTEGKSAPLIYGTGIHHALEAYYRGETDLDKILARGYQEFTDVPESLLEWRNADRYRQTISEYIKHYQKDDAELIHILKLGTESMVEQAFALPLTQVKVNAHVPFSRSLIVHPHDGHDNFNPDSVYIATIHVQWTGVIDLAFTTSGANWTSDHKTSSIGGQSFWDTFRLSQQFRGYTWAAQQLMGVDFKGTLANVIFGRKPTEKGKGKTLEFERQWVHYRPDQIEEWRVGMIQHVEDFINNLVHNRFPENSLSCVNKFRTCEFIDVCTMPEQQRLTMLNSDVFSWNTWNPLT